MHHIELSIIIPCYNHAEWLPRCIESVASQNLKASFEVILVDDCSTDNFLEIFKTLQQRYPWLKLVQNIENLGAAASRNRGVEQSSGELIFFLDADDELLPGVSSRALQAAQEQPSDFYIFGLLTINSAGDDNYKHLPPLTESCEKNLKIYLQGKLRFGQGSYLVRRSAFLCFPFEQRFRIDEDAYLFYQLFANFRATTIDFPMVKYYTELGHVRTDLDRRLAQGFDVEDLFFSTDTGKRQSPEIKELAYFKRCNSLMKRSLQSGKPEKAVQFYQMAVSREPSLKFKKKLFRKFLKSRIRMWFNFI